MSKEEMEPLSRANDVMEIKENHVPNLILPLTSFCLYGMVSDSGRTIRS
jgi:hypothetical protein